MTTPNLSTNSGTSVQRKWCLGGWSLKMRLPKFWTTTIDPSVRDAMIETYFLCTDEMGGCLSRCQYIWNYIFKDKLHLPIFSPVTKQNTSKSIQRSILKEPIIQFQPFVMETTLKVLLTHTHTHTHTQTYIYIYTQTSIPRVILSTLSFHEHKDKKLYIRVWSLSSVQHALPISSSVM